MQCTEAQVKIDYVAVKNAALKVHSLKHKVRQQIIKLLEENRRMNSTDISVKLRVEQPFASQHLAIMRRANIVLTERVGKEIYYSLNLIKIEQVCSFATQITPA